MHTAFSFGRVVWFGLWDSLPSATHNNPVHSTCFRLVVPLIAHACHASPLYLLLGWMARGHITLHVGRTNELGRTRRMCILEGVHSSPEHVHDWLFFLTMVHVHWNEEPKDIPTCQTKKRACDHAQLKLQGHHTDPEGSSMLFIFVVCNFVERP